MQRAPGIDAIRFVMAFFVVLRHSMPTVSSVEYEFLSMACRGPVPFFLIVTGYYIRQKMRFSSDMLKSPLFKLAPVYIFWMLLYYSVAAFTDVSTLQLGLRDLVSGGTAFHLWYLPTIGFAIFAVSVGLAIFGFKITGLICGTIGVIALCVGPYHDILGLPGETRRGGMLFAPSFVFVGHALARWQPTLSIRQSIALVCLGFIALVLEEVNISIASGKEIMSHDFVISSYLVGIGIFLLARCLNHNSAIIPFARFGTLSFGIYLSQLLFLWAFRAILTVDSLPSVAALAIASFACAAVLTALYWRAVEIDALQPSALRSRFMPRVSQ